MTNDPKQPETAKDEAKKKTAAAEDAPSDSDGQIGTTLREKIEYLLQLLTRIAQGLETLETCGKAHGKAKKTLKRLIAHEQKDEAEWDRADYEEYWTKTWLEIHETQQEARAILLCQLLSNFISEAYLTLQSDVALKDFILARSEPDDRFCQELPETGFKNALWRRMIVIVHDSLRAEEIEELIEHFELVLRRAEKKAVQVLALPDTELPATTASPGPTGTPGGGAVSKQTDETDKHTKKRRRSSTVKFAAITACLEKQPNATSKDVERITGINNTNVRHVWGPIKKALKEGKREKTRGEEGKSIEDTIDERTSCKLCAIPLSDSFECEFCQDIIVGECKTCHFTNTHPDKATP